MFYGIWCIDFGFNAYNINYENTFSGRLASTFFRNTLLSVYTYQLRLSSGLGTNTIPVHPWLNVEFL